MKFNYSNERGNFCIFVIAMGLAIGAAAIDRAFPTPAPIHVTLPDGNVVLAKDVFCDKNRFVVDLGNQQVTIPSGYVYDRTGEQTGRFILHLKTASAASLNGRRDF